MMADEFERMLSEALAPEARDPDRLFVARVQAGIALDERFAAERRSGLRQLGAEVLGLAAIAGGLLWLGRSEPISGFFAESPAIALAAVIAAFTLAVLVLRSPESDYAPNSSI
jgi:hypothetical protein